MPTHISDVIKLIPGDADFAMGEAEATVRLLRLILGGLLAKQSFNPDTRWTTLNSPQRSGGMCPKRPKLISDGRKARRRPLQG